MCFKALLIEIMLYVTKLFAIYLEFKVLIAFEFYFFAAPCKLQDHSSPTRDQTWALALEMKNPPSKFSQLFATSFSFFPKKIIRSLRVQMLIVLSFKVVNDFYLLLCALVYFLNIIQRTSIPVVIRKGY